MMEIEKLGGGKVVRTEYTTMDTNTGVAVNHKCNTYFLKDGKQEIVFRKRSDEVSPIIWEKVSEV